jgi:hypothetical protein
MNNPIQVFEKIRDNFILYLETAFGTRYPDFEQERNALIVRRLKEVGFDHANFKGKKHSEETLNRMREVKVGHGKGDKNSQFGTCWVTHSELGNKKIGKDDLDKFLSLGYTKGRKIIAV